MIKDMDDAKLPDLNEIRSGRKNDSALPPQASAEDTSNWDDRTFTTPKIGAERELIFDTLPAEVAGVIPNPLLEQERNKSAIRAKKKIIH